MPLTALLIGLCALLGAHAAFAQPADCNQPAVAAISQVALPGHPFSAIPTADGCTLFVSLTPTQAGETSKLAVLSRRNGQVSLVRTVPAGFQATGMALSPDGRMLAVADNHGVLLFDTARLIGGADALVAMAEDGANADAVYTAFSADGRLLAVSDEGAQAVTIYDFAAFTAGQSLKAIGKVHTGYGPTGLTFSPDSKRLYVVVQIAAAPGAQCAFEGGQGASHAPGLLTVIDASRAATDPARAVLAEIPAGCNPVRVAVSPKGDRAYVSMRGGDSLGVFDTAKLLSDRAHAALAVLKVGKSPVGLVASDKMVFVTNSDRFGGNDTQSVYAIDPGNLAHAKSIPAGGFPRELKLTADGATLLVTNFTTSGLELVDLARLP